MRNRLEQAIKRSDIKSRFPGAFLCLFTLISANLQAISCEEYLAILGREGKASHFSDKNYKRQLETALADKVRAELKGQGLSEAEIEKFVLHLMYPLGEIYLNALEHANRYKADKRVYTTISIDKGQLVVEISDESGKFFDAFDKTEPVNALGLRAVTGADSADADALADRRLTAGHVPFREDGEGGRGIMSTEGLVDTVSYRPHRNKEGAEVGTTVRLGWNLPKKNAAKE